MKAHSNKSAKKLLVFILFLPVINLSACFKSNYELPEPVPGISLGIASIPNLRDMGGYKTTTGATFARRLIYRSNQLYNISADDMLLLSTLKLKNDFDLRTATERNAKPDELPTGVNNVWLNVLADDPSSGPANLINLLADPVKANAELGNGQVEKNFETAYRQFISLPSAQTAFRKLFMALENKDQLPAIFHCTTGKDRTGWAAAALLTFVGVPMETVIADYMRSNDNILPMYQSFIQKFINAGGYPHIPAAILGVKEEYLRAAFDEMQIKYGSIENYFSQGLGITTEQQAALRAICLDNK